MARGYGWHERHQTYTTIRNILDRFERDDTALVAMIRVVEPDGFPSGGSGGGHGAGEHSDPTAGTVTRTCTNPRCRFVEQHAHAPDPATHVFLELQEALVAFAKADTARRFALPPRAEEEPPPLIDGEAKTPKRADDVWCTSCIRATQDDDTPLLVPRTTRVGGRRDLCDWCQGEWLGSSTKLGDRRLPDPRLCLAHDQGVRLTEQARRKILSTPAKSRKQRTA